MNSAARQKPITTRTATHTAKWVTIGSSRTAAAAVAANAAYPRM